MRPRNTAGAGPAHKHEARRLQNLTKQRERLEADVRAAEEEILHLVLNDLHLGPVVVSDRVSRNERIGGSPYMPIRIHSKFT